MDGNRELVNNGNLHLNTGKAQKIKFSEKLSDIDGYKILTTKHGGCYFSDSLSAHITKMWLFYQLIWLIATMKVLSFIRSYNSALQKVLV